MNIKNMKKVLALALGFVMTLGLMPGMEIKVLAAGKVASLTMKYYTYTSSGQRTYGEYTPDVSEFTSLDAAFAAAADRTYLEKVGTGDDVAGKEHLKAIVKLSSVKNSAKKTLTAKWKKASGAKGYQVQYALNRKFTKGKKSKIVTKTSLKIKKLKKKNTYYVRVREYKLKANGKKKYGAWSAVKKVKIKK